MPRNKEIPTERIIQMKNQGLPNNEIISALQQEGYKHDQISNAMDQASVKSELSSMGMPGQEPVENREVPLALMNAPSPSSGEEELRPISHNEQPRLQEQPPSNFAPEPLERASYDAIEEIAESIIKEKWNEMLQNVGDIKLWKERTDIDLEGVKQELIRTQEKFENLQGALMGKISEYSEGVTTIGTEMKALERVLEKILAPLTKSVKDLERVADKLSSPKKPAIRKK
jgi:hypothetical protein